MSDYNLLNHLGFPQVKISKALSHFNFLEGGQITLIVGPMGAGKTELAARILNDSKVLLNKNPHGSPFSSFEGRDRRKIYVIRSNLDKSRFIEYPEKALAYRSGYTLWEKISFINESEQLKELIESNPDIGTWIIDEGVFYSEDITYIIYKKSNQYHLNFIIPTLILNFRNEIFNTTARLLLEVSKEILLLDAYCEHPECLDNSIYTYRFYSHEGKECPACFFDPLVLIGGDNVKTQSSQANYQTRCLKHHYLMGKEYVYLYLKPLARQAMYNHYLLLDELNKIKYHFTDSQLYASLKKENEETSLEKKALINHIIYTPHLCERVLNFLWKELSLLDSEFLKHCANKLNLNVDFFQFFPNHAN